MAADVEGFENDEQWLYGDNNEGNPPELQDEATDFTEDIEQSKPDSVEPVPDNSEPPPDKIAEDEGPPGLENQDDPENSPAENDAEDGELKQNGDEEDLDDESDDDVNVVIGEIKNTTTYAPVNIKRGGLTTTIGDKNKTINQVASKFNVEEFEQIGTINGVPANDYNIDTIEDKPWRKPGADITDYFNYGFNEDTWKAYCERQKRIRISETGIGIVPLNAIGLPTRPMNVLMNDNSKYNPNFMGMNNIRPPMQPKHEPPKMNTIQVMTADRREYSRKPNAFPDMSVPPPAGAYEPFEPAYAFNPEPEPFYGYEPTQDSQWAQANPNWTPTDIKTLTGAPPQMCPPPQSGAPMGPPHSRREISPSQRYSPSRRSPSRDRERESRSRSERPRDHDREKSRRRERSRSKSRKHRSRSRSPGHRSHKKKKSRRHEESD